MQESRLKMCGQKDKLCSSQMSCGPSPFQFFLQRYIWLKKQAHDPSKNLWSCMTTNLGCSFVMNQEWARPQQKRWTSSWGKPMKLQGEAFSPPLAHPSPGLARVLKVHSLGCFNWIELRVCLRLWILMRFQDIFCIIFSALDRIKMK